MATRGIALTLAYVAWDTINNVYKTGDAGNHTLRWIKDGTAAAPSGSPSEVDATNAPGVYKLSLTATETDCNLGVLVGKSSTTGVSIMPVMVQFERLPDATPGSAGGVPTVDGNNRIAGIQGTKHRLDDLADTTPAQIWGYETRTLTAFGFQVTLTSAYDRAKTALATSEYTAPDNASVSAIKAKTDKLQFTTDNYVQTVATNLSESGIAGAVWGATSRTLTAFGFEVTVAAASVGAIVDATWDEVLSGHTESGSAGQALAAAAAGASTAAIADAVWDELLSGHTTVGSAGYYLANAGGGSSPEVIADAVLDELVSDHATAGSLGQVVSAINTHTAGIVPGAAITLVQPVTAAGDVTLVRGDTYSATDGRALAWSSSSWPDLTGATITMTARDKSDAVGLSASGVVSGAGTGTQTVRVELSATDTAALTVGFRTYQYDVEAVIAGRHITLVRGYLTVLADQTR
jgi:hypothetical protein